MVDKDLNNPERRQFLEKATGMVSVAGIAVATWPFIDSMNPTESDLSQASAEVNLDGIEVGESKTVEWQGKPVFVFHRTPEQIKTMRVSSGSDIDPEPDQARVQKPEWLVVVGLCTHLGCVPPKSSNGWRCPCHGSVFDNSGRVMKPPAPRNLVVPAYQFVSENRINIGS